MRDLVEVPEHDHVDDFRRFLELYGVLDQYKANMLEDTTSCEHSEELVPSHFTSCDSFIHYAFAWEDTPEGSSFWNNISKAWVTLCVVKSSFLYKYKFQR